MLWIVPVLPLASVAANLLIGDRLGKRGTTALACGSVVAAFAFALRAVLHLASLPEAERHLTETAWTWFRVGDFSANVSFLLERRTRSDTRPRTDAARDVWPAD